MVRGIGVNRLIEFCTQSEVGERRGEGVSSLVKLEFKSKMGEEGRE